MHTLDIPFNQLIPAPNKIRQEPTNLEPLAASLTEHGQLQSILVRPTANDRYTVIAGNRRYGAFQLLIERKSITPEHPIACRILNTNNTSEIQLAENDLREQMKPLDEYEAYASILTAPDQPSATIEDICKRFGKSERQIKQRLKLGLIAKPILQAIRSGTLTLEAAYQFVRIDNTDEQLKIFNALKKNNDLSIFYIKKAIENNRIQSNDRLAILVGKDAFIEAGGTIENDLFEEGALWGRRTILETLASQRLKEIALTLKERRGWAWCEVLDLEYTYSPWMDGGTTLEPTGKTPAKDLKTLIDEFKPLVSPAQKSDEAIRAYECTLKHLKTTFSKKIPSKLHGLGRGEDIPGY